MLDRRKKDNKAVKKQIERLNKMLKEDCFAGRFEVKKIGQKDFQVPNYLINTPWLYTIDQVNDATWRYAIYQIELIDNEQPERNVVYHCKYSRSFGLCDLIYDYEKSNDKSFPNYAGNSGLSTVFFAMNNFIIKSDFWEKWNNDIEYMKTHWYSGDELKARIKVDDIFSEPEKLMEHRAKRNNEVQSNNSGE